MRPLLVVNDEPALGQRADLRQRLEEMRIEHLGAIAAIEALDEGILIGLSRLDIVEVDPEARDSNQASPRLYVERGNELTEQSYLMDYRDLDKLPEAFELTFGEIHWS